VGLGGWGGWGSGRGEGRESVRRARQALTGPRGWGAHSVDGVCGLGAGGESSPAPSPNGHIRLTSRALGPASRGQPDAGHASRSPLVRPRHAAPCSSCRVRVRGGGGSTPLDTALLCVVILPLYVLFFPPNCSFYRVRGFFRQNKYTPAMAQTVRVRHNGEVRLL